MVLIMNRKKVIFLLVSLVFMVSLASVVNAQTRDYVPDILKDFFKWVFLTLPEQARAGDEAFVIYFRLIIWLLIFAILYYGASKVFKDSPRIAGTVAFVFALISAMMIPKAFLIFIFAEYGGVASILLALAPVFLGMYIRRQIPEEHINLRNGVILLIGFLLVIVGTYFSGYGLTVGDVNKFYADFGNWATLIGIGTVILGFLGFRIGGRSGQAAETPENIVENERRQRDQEQALEADERRMEQMNERLEAYDRQLDEYAQRLNEIVQNAQIDELQRLRNIAELIRELEGVTQRLQYAAGRR